MRKNAGTPDDAQQRVALSDACVSTPDAASAPGDAARIDAAQTPSAPAEFDLIQMVTAHYEALYRYAYRLSGDSHDAEDLAQQTFLVARQKADCVRDALALRGWLFTVLRNVYLKNLRRRAPLAAGSLSLVLEDVPEESDESPIDSQRLQGALDRLPHEYRVALLMFYFEELSYREISQALGVPLGTVMSRLARAKQHLRRELRSLEEAASQRSGVFGARDAWNAKVGKRARAKR